MGWVRLRLRCASAIKEAQTFGLFPEEFQPEHWPLLAIAAGAHKWMLDAAVWMQPDNWNKFKNYANEQFSISSMYPTARWVIKMELNSLLNKIPALQKRWLWAGLSPKHNVKSLWQCCHLELTWTCKTLWGADERWPGWHFHWPLEEKKSSEWPQWWNQKSTPVHRWSAMWENLE